MLRYLIYVEKYENALYNTIKLHRMHKYYHTYKLQYTHCFFRARTGLGVYNSDKFLNNSSF